MPGPVAPQSHTDSPGGQIPTGAGHLRSSVMDRTCAALARCAEKYDQLAIHTAELAQGADAAAAKAKAIREALVAKHG